MIILYFTKVGCAPCKAYLPKLLNWAAVNPLFEIGQIDVEKFPVTTHEYGIESVPTMVVLKNNVEVFRHCGTDRSPQDLFGHL